MKMYTEQALRNFEFWSGARSNAAMLTTEELDTVETILEDVFSDGVEDVTINDLFWFEFEIVCEWLGYKWNDEKCEIEREAEIED